VLPQMIHDHDDMELHSVHRARRVHVGVDMESLGRDQKSRISHSWEPFSSQYRY
jgi:hypothetical protein